MLSNSISNIKNIIKEGEAQIYSLGTQILLSLIAPNIRYGIYAGKESTQCYSEFTLLLFISIHSTRLDRLLLFALLKSNKSSKCHLHYLSHSKSILTLQDGEILVLLISPQI